jgi:murein DD-endopeptidase MepM/ murein hydrolase activator NlpD
VLGTKRFHKGDDWGTEVGTPLFAPVEGQVKCFEQPEGAGTYGRFFPDAWTDREWMVAHLSVCEEGHYHPKEVWGKTGNSGGLTTGPHAHFEFWTPLDGVWADRDVPKGWWAAFATGEIPKA